MSGVELKANDKALPGIQRRSVLSSIHVLPMLVTVVAVCAAAALGWQAWQYYMGAPLDARWHGPRLCCENRP
jgi:hypothetical protein